MEGPLYYTQEVSIKCDLDNVWNALIDPGLTKLYMFGCEAISEWREGSRLDWVGAADGITYVTGEIVKFEPNKNLAFTVVDPNSTFNDPPGVYLVSQYSLFDSSGFTTVSIKQGDFSQVDQGIKRFEESSGSWKIVLESLKKLLEG